MAIVPMADAVPGEAASSAEYNKVIDNIVDIDARLGAVVSASTAHARLNTLETRTTDTTTGGSTLGIGNQRLADRLGTGVSNTTNVTTGTATAQLTDLRSRATALESTTTNGTSGNSALNTRLSTVESTVTNGTSGNSALNTRLAAAEAKIAAATVQSAPGNSGTVTATTYTETRTSAPSEAGVAFTAPPSGKVKIFWGSGITISTTTNFALASFVIRNGGTVGSGTTVQAADDTIVCQNTGITSEQSYMNFYLLTGLTAGNQYNIRMAYRVGGGGSPTGTFNRPKVLVEPVMS